MTRVSVNTSGAIITGILTATAGNDLNGYKVENGSISGSGLNGVINYNLDDGHIQKYTGSIGNICNQTLKDQKLCLVLWMLVML